MKKKQVEHVDAFGWLHSDGIDEDERGRRRAAFDEAVDRMVEEAAGKRVAGRLDVQAKKGRV